MCGRIYIKKTGWLLLGIKLNSSVKLIHLLSRKKIRIKRLLQGKNNLYSEISSLEEYPCIINYLNMIFCPLIMLLHLEL